MLIISETILFIIGIIIVISGKLPKIVITLLLGIDNLELPKKIIRIIGIFILSPAPVALLVSIILTIFFGDRYKTFNQVFEIAYLFIMLILLVLFSRRVSHLLKSNSKKLNSSNKERMLLIELYKPILLIGITITSLLTFVIVLNLPIITNIIFQSKVNGTENIWDIIVPYLILIPIIIIGIITTIIFGKLYNNNNK